MQESTPKITDTQWEKLRRLNCKVPPRSLSRASASRLISYIKQGNGTLGAAPDTRAVIVQTYREKYLGKRVFCKEGHTDSGRVGIITDIRARLIDEVVKVRKSLAYWEHPEHEVSPFAALVRWEATDTLPEKHTPSFSAVSLFYLELIEE